ncbi:spore coat protein YsxE [Litchfieldia alkalitelluris]|uniref:spore coat protein YsxE n=1 Tax=Litchfieldia alkalitelluris TaxID=304268 RepID=UPI0014760A00|nr:spore coat protein YsxE [Litchfieldia alkalitelluris]
MTTIGKIEYGPILQKYNLSVDYLEEINSRVTKIYTQHGTYALKEISNSQNLHFIRHIDNLYKDGFTKIVPIFQTVDKKYVVNHENKFFYLMPWLSNDSHTERESKHHQLFKLLARLHTVTSKEAKFSEDDVKHHYQSLKDTWEKRNKYLEDYVEECEKKLYMSPFELQFVTHYNEMMQACHFAMARLDEWYEKVVEVKKFRTALTHGKVTSNHLLYDKAGSGYFSSFEKAKQATPVNDLISFYYRTLRTYPINCDDCIEWYNHYNQHYHLRDEEIQLFLSYLTYPEPMYREVVKYKERKKEGNEQKAVTNFLKSYWLNKNIEYVASLVMKQEHEKKEQQMAAEFEKQQEEENEQSKNE